MDLRIRYLDLLKNSGRGRSRDNNMQYTVVYRYLRLVRKNAIFNIYDGENVTYI